MRRHALTLAIATGQDVSSIEREIFTRKITPGGWAAEHGLDPATLPAEDRDVNGHVARGCG